MKRRLPLPSASTKNVWKDGSQRRLTYRNLWPNYVAQQRAQRLSSRGSGIRYESAKDACIFVSLTENLRGAPRRRRSKKSVTESNERDDEPRQPKRFDWKKSMKGEVEKALSQRSLPLRKLTKRVLHPHLTPDELQIEEMMLASLEAQRMGLLGPLYTPTLEEIFATKNLESTRSPSSQMKKDRPSAKRKRSED